jgi:hypothetical protein
MTTSEYAARLLLEFLDRADGEQAREEAREVLRAFEELGFTLEGTGGNCTALIRRYDKEGMAHYITSLEDEALAPTRFAERCILGLYKDGEGEPVADALDDSARGMLSLFRQGCDAIAPEGA